MLKSTEFVWKWNFLILPKLGKTSNYINKIYSVFLINNVEKNVIFQMQYLYNIDLACNVMWGRVSCSKSLKEKELLGPHKGEGKGDHEGPVVQTNSKISSISSAFKFSMVLASCFTLISSFTRFIVHSCPGGIVRKLILLQSPGFNSSISFLSHINIMFVKFFPVIDLTSL